MFKVTKKHNVSNIFKVNNKDTRTTSGASVVNFEHISHFTLQLILLNSNKLIPFGPEKRLFPTINLFSMTMRNILFYGPKKFVGVCFHLYSPSIRLLKDKFSHHFKKISRTLFLIINYR